MNAVQLHTDVIVIGAGPAGAATSIFLSQKGIPHIVLEKEKFPRDKVCGDACSGKTAFVLRKANPQWMESIMADSRQFAPCFGITFIAPNGKPLEIPFTSKRTPETKAPGFISPRMIFDNFLFEKIASPFASVYQQAKINEIARQDGNATVSFIQNGRIYHATAPIVAGADGDKSIVRKNFLTAGISPKAYAVGLRAYYSGIADLHPDNFLELHFLPEIQPGYLWIFPLSNGMANVGVGILSEKIRKKKINLREQMLYALKHNPALSARFKNATLTDKIQGWGLPLATERQPVSGDHFLLTGDAASLVDPFSGEGIGNALYSGMLAANAVKESLQAKQYDATFFKAHYDDILYHKLGNEFRISASMQRLCNYPWLFNFVVNKAYKSPSLKETISCMFTDMDLRDKLRKPSFYLNILLNR